MSTLTVTGWLLPLVTMPDCGSTVSQLDPSLVALDALHCKGSFPGLLTVTICPGGSTLPSVPVKVSTGGVSWTASCSGRKRLNDHFHWQGNPPGIRSKNHAGAIRPRVEIRAITRNRYL